MRLVDADAYEEYFYEHMDDLHMAAAKNALDEMPTIDAVPVVRCKDCKYWDVGNTEFCLNGRYGGCETAQDWYCLDGERKDDE